MKTAWIKNRDADYHHTASTIYTINGFRIWKGKRRIISCIYSADKWHLERVADGKVIYSERTAKKCMAAYEYALNAAHIDLDTTIGIPYC